MRLDFAIIWGHGMQYIDDILGILRQYKGLELVWFQKYSPPDFNKFVSQVYGLDTVPLEHLMAKNEYLKDVGRDVYIMLIRNHRPQPVMVGTGKFRHEQCMLMNKFKWHVRERFNPVRNGERTEEHIIHCSDYETQTEQFMATMGLGHKYDWTLSKTSEVPWTPYYIDKFNDFVIKEYDVDKLFANVLTDTNVKECRPLKQSPHYKYVVGDREEYINYWNKYKGTKLTEDHTPSKFDGLVNWLTLDKYKEMNKVVIISGGIIIDGVHRAAVLASQNEDKIVVLDINNGD